MPQMPTTAAGWSSVIATVARWLPATLASCSAGVCIACGVGCESGVEGLAREPTGEPTGEHASAIMQPHQDSWLSGFVFAATSYRLSAPAHTYLLSRPGGVWLSPSTRPQISSRPMSSCVSTNAHAYDCIEAWNHPARALSLCLAGYMSVCLTAGLSVLSVTRSVFSMATPEAHDQIPRYSRRG